MKKSILLLLVFFAGTISAFAQDKFEYPFQNPALSISARVNDLVSRLTLEEKVNQMLNSTPAI
ncbi:MAG: hypothetical protein ABI136_02585, partial [Ginsengibacter sp.]